MKNLADIINKVHCADCLEFMRDMPDECVDCVVTSPPYYGLRDYGVDGQIGLEPTMKEYIARLAEVFGECKRVLKKTGTIWVNIGDSYAGTGDKGGWLDPKYPNGRTGQAKSINRMVKGVQEKSLCQVPERLSLALTDELGLIKRNTIIWYKRNCMPSSVGDRFTVDFEYLYFFAKSKNYWFEQQFEQGNFDAHKMQSYHKPNNPKYESAADERWKDQFDGRSWGSVGVRNKRTVWDIPTESFGEAHFAVFPRALVYTPIKAGCPPNGIVLDPFAGSGTTCLEAKEKGKNYIGIELNPEYLNIAEKRLRQEVLPLGYVQGALK